jgi:alpha-galactosidase
MRDAIAKQSHPILFSLCEWGQADVTTWGNATASSWRTTGDLTRKSPARSSTKVEEFRTDMSSYCTEWLTIQIRTAKWSAIAQILNENSFLLNAVDFWGHNDADILEVGNGALTAAETRTHFAFWAAMKSPLLIGTNVNLSSHICKTLDQD